MTLIFQTKTNDLHTPTPVKYRLLQKAMNKWVALFIISDKFWQQSYLLQRAD